MDTDEQGESGRYLPPEPGGLEPDLGPAPAPQPPQPQLQQPHQPQQTQWTPPPPGWYPQQQQQQQQQQPWVYQPQPPKEPDNGSAVAGFTLSVVGGALLLISAGISSIVSVVCAGLGIFYSLRGRRAVDRGETPKHRGLAQAGFVTGIVTLVLAVLATAFWLLILILALTDEEFQNDLENDFENSTAMLAMVAARAIVSLAA